MIAIVLIIFLGMCLQGLMTFYQVKNYQKAINSLKGKGLLGIGYRRGLLRGGRILILSYDRKSDKINNCKMMSGISSFERFKTEEKYIGQSLEEIKAQALSEEEKTNKIRKAGDTKEIPLQKRGALYQAIFAIESHLQREERQKLQESRRRERSITNPI